MFKKFTHLKKIEKIVVVFLLVIVIITGFKIGHAFYEENSAITPIKGGIYTEGAVGKVGQINPLYIQYGTLTHDLTQLIFSGLTKYDIKTGDVIPDLADFKMSKNGKTYTFVIKENAKWHDGTQVTSNDIIFTYNTVIKNPDFNGLILNYNDYSKIKIIKIDNRTVEFLLEEPDSFFLVKTLIGILPEHLLGHTSVKTLNQNPFNMLPIGTGPYKFVSMAPAASAKNCIEIILNANDDFYGSKPNIPTMQIKIFSTFEDLIKKQGELDGIRNVPAEYADKILKKKHLSLTKYSLPQYVAIFMNTQSDKLKNSKIRLALQLGIDKESLIKKINQDKIIDTPLLEIDQKNWVYQYSTKKANGALFETEWQIPNKDQLPITNDQLSTKDTKPTAKEVKKPTYITNPNGGNDWQTSDKKITITGTNPDKTKSIIINEYKLRKFVPGNKSWSYIASFDYKNLKKGKNEFKVYAIDFNDKKSLIDSITITQGNLEEFAEKEMEKLEDENKNAQVLPIRKNKKGQELALKLVVPEKPKDYGIVASILKEQWQKIGVHTNITILNTKDFNQALAKRDYDLLIFGQNLGYNLDAYPYWHSSQAKKDGYNLSQFKNFVADSLLDNARSQHNVKDRKKTLNDLQKIISKEIPAVFLYSPTYNFALSDKIQNSDFNNLATTSDRFSGIENWYAKADRKLNKGVNPFTFISWIIKQF